MIDKRLEDMKRDIEKMKKRLIQRAKKKGLYEYFGNKEIRELYDKYILLLTDTYEVRTEASRLFDEFREWCYNFEGR